MLGFNDTSTLEGHFVSSPREREKRDRRESRGDEREGQGRKRNRNESEETEEIKTFPLYPYPLQGYRTGSATLLRVAISSVETRKSRDFLWWKLRGISEEVTRVHRVAWKTSVEILATSV